VVEKDGTFIRGDWEELIKLEVKVVKLSLQDKFVLEFRKVVSFCTKATDRWIAAERGGGENVVISSSKI